MNRERGGVRIVRGDEIHLGVLKGCDEMEMPADSVQLGHAKPVSVGLTFFEGLRQNRTVGPFAGFNFNILADDFGLARPAAPFVEKKVSKTYSRTCRQTNLLGSPPPLRRSATN